MNKPLFNLVRRWCLDQLGVDLVHLVWAIAICVPVRKYSRATIKWVSENATNSLELAPGDPLTTDLLIWISKQPSNQLFAWLPTFEHLEWKNLQHEAKTRDNEEGKTHQLIASAGYTPFFFQGVLFIMYKPESQDYNGKLILRCLWGSSQPMEALLKDVHKDAKSENKHLRITYISMGQNRTNKCRKRLLETVDIDPLAKQQLLTDLQDFLDDDTEDYYYQNGTPYRRGYLFYGPAGTGKTSLSTAIASNYDLPLYVIDVAGMNDSVLQEKIQALPKRCVILFEDIDAAGIKRERTMVSPVRSQEDVIDTNSYATATGSDVSCSPSGTKKAKLELPQRTAVTLSGLLNTLDGPGSKEGHIVILTTNSPDSLDQALYRPGQIDMQLYLGYSTKITAGITFTRIFGSDKRLNMSKKELSRMGRRFGNMIPSNFLTPAETQKFCMNRRGQPHKALAEFRKFINEKRAGQVAFEYDINRMAPEPVFDEHEEYEDGYGSTEGSSAMTTLDRPGEIIAADSIPDDLARATQWPEAREKKPGQVTPPRVSTSNKEQLQVTGNIVWSVPDGLAYGDYYPSAYEDSVLDKVGKTMEQVYQGVKVTLTLPFLRKPSSSIRAPNDRESGPSMPLESPGPLPTEEDPDVPSIGVRSSTVDIAYTPPPSPATTTEVSAYYTPLSLGEQIEESFQHYRRPNHPDVLGRNNIYPYHGCLSDIEDDNPWEEKRHKRDRTILLRNVAPQPLEESVLPWSDDNVQHSPTERENGT